MKIERATFGDLDDISRIDPEIPTEILARKIREGEILIVRKQRKIIGYLRYSFFWDKIPFLNMLIVDSEVRRQGYGTAIVRFWEEKMSEEGFDFLMTSTQSDEDGQHFFRGLGYNQSGHCDFPNQAEEIMLSKNHKKNQPNRVPATD